MWGGHTVPSPAWGLGEGWAAIGFETQRQVEPVDIFSSAPALWNFPPTRPSLGLLGGQLSRRAAHQGSVACEAVASSRLVQLTAARVLLSPSPCADILALKPWGGEGPGRPRPQTSAHYAAGLLESSGLRCLWVLRRRGLGSCLQGWGRPQGSPLSTHSTYHGPAVSAACLC